MKKLLLAAMIGLILAILMPMLFSFGAYGYLEAFEIMLPGIEVGGVQLEGLTIHEASAKLNQAWNEGYSLLVVDTMDPERTWTLEPSRFGLRVDAQASAQQAHSIGRGEGILAGVEQMYGEGWQGEPRILFDRVVARAALMDWAQLVYVPPVEGRLTLEGDQIIQSTGLAGKTLDVEATLDLLEADPSGVMLTYRFVPLVMVPVEPKIKDVSDAAAKAEGLLESEPTLSVYDPVTDEWFVWTANRGEVASWIELHREESVFSVQVVEDRIANYVSGLNSTLGEERFFDLELARNALDAGLERMHSPALQVHYQPTTYVVQRPQSLISLGVSLGMPFWKLIDVNPQLAGRDPFVGETITLPPKDVNLSLPVVMNKRIVISITEQRMWVVQDGEVIKENVISTGIADSPTMPGIFQVQSHFENAYASSWDLWMPHFLGIYDAVPGFENGIHGLPLLSNGVRLWGSVLGQPASFGCIILDLESAEELYNWAEDGVVVEILR
jgi:hypothetical protein